MCAGDFNEIFMFRDKESGLNRARLGMLDFRECLDDCGPRDLPFSGDKFTWDNGKSSAENIREHLDRVVASHD